MFILGLVLGPALGLLAGDWLRSRAGMRVQVAVGSAIAVLLAVALLPLGDMELRLGLVAGMGLGLLLSITPEQVSPALESDV